MAAVGEGDELRQWIGITLADLRERVGLSRAYMAKVLDMDERKIRRIEGVDGPEHQSYNNIDRVVAAYALALGFEDARDLWQLALSRWMKAGGVPAHDLQLPDEPQAFLWSIQAVDRQRAQATSARRGKPTASRTRRAGQ